MLLFICKIKQCFPIIIVIAVLLLTILNSTSAGLIRRILGQKSESQTQPLASVTVPLAKRLSEYSNGKKNVEAFLALMTAPLGFVNCDMQQESHIETFIQYFNRMKRTYPIRIESADKIQKRRKETPLKTCRTYLADPVLQYNKIQLVKTRISQIKTTNKIVHFNYYLKSPKNIEVLQCPINHRDNDDIMLIYFSTFSKPIDGVQTYFVLTASSSKDDSELKVLMRTQVNIDDIKDDDETRTNNVKIKQTSDKYTFDFEGAICLNIPEKKHRGEGYLALFGKNAERAFITTGYGFWDPTTDEGILDRFINSALKQSKDYEIKSKPRSLKKYYSTENLSQFCEKYIMTSILLNEKGISYDADRSNQIRFVKQKLFFPSTGLPVKNYSFVECPVSSGRDRSVILLNDIEYIEGSKCSDHSLSWYTITDEEGKVTQQLLLSPLIKNENENGREIVIMEESNVT